MSVSSVTGNTIGSAVAQASGTTMSSADFLTLIVAELQNQNPLDVTSTSDLINQMSSYANFDQQQALNNQFGNLLTSFNSFVTLNSVNYIGHTVEAKGDTTTLTNGQAMFGYSLNSSAQSVSLTIQDASGNIVWSGTGPGSAGLNRIAWDGTTNSGAQLPDGGQYTLHVTAVDANGNSVYGYSTVSGTVSGIDTSSGTAMLDVGGVPISISNVIGVTS